MTISSSTSKSGPYVGNGSTTNFPFTYKVFSGSDINVVLTVSGADTELTLDSDYSVVLNANQNSNPGGYVVYPISGSPLASTGQITVYRDAEYTQETDLLDGGNWSPETVEDALDKVTMLSQQLLEATWRSIKVPVSSASDVSSTLPAPAPSQAFAWDSLGKSLIAYDVSDVLGTSYASKVIDNYADGVDFTAGVTTALTLSADPGGESNVLVTFDGVSQHHDTFSVSGTTITFDSPIPGGTQAVEILTGRTASIGYTTSELVTHKPTGYTERTVESALTDHLRTPDFGAVGNGVADDTAQLQAVYDARGANLSKVTVRQGSTYLITDTIDVDDANYTTLDHRGAKFTTALDIAMFDLNPDNDNTSGTIKRMCRVEGGFYLGTHASPAASIGIKANGYRNLAICDAEIDGFYKGIECSGWDSITLERLHLYNNEIGISVPANLATAHLIMTILNTHFSVTGAMYGIDVQEEWGDVHVIGGSFNGALSSGGSMVRMTDNPSSSPRGFVMQGVHCEQGAANTNYLYFDRNNSKFFLGIDIRGNNFGTSANGLCAVRMEAVIGAVISGNNFSQTEQTSLSDASVTASSDQLTRGSGSWVTDGVVAGQYIVMNGVPMGTTVVSVDDATTITMSANATLTWSDIGCVITQGIPVYLDANCADITMSSNYLSTGKIIYLCDRSEITMLPEIRASGVQLGAYNGDSFSTGSGYINMAAEIGATYPSEMNPKGYWVHLRAADSGSAAGAPEVHLKQVSGSGATTSLSLYLKGVGNDEQRVVSGYVPADDYGNIYINRTATGSGTLDIWITVTAVHM